MSWEAEANVTGMGGARCKSVAKPPLILKPCEHLVEKEGRLRKKLILIHGMANGTVKLRKVKV